MYATALIYLAMVTPYYGDLIAQQPGLDTVIGEPLSHVGATVHTEQYGLYVIDEYQTLRKAIWNRELSNIIAARERDLPPEIQIPEPHQQMAFDYLQKGGPLRGGDFTALHGSLLSALQPDTYTMAKKWQGLLQCATSEQDDSSCVEYGY